MKSILFLALVFVATSCSPNLNKSYVTLNPTILIKKSDIGNDAKVKLSVKKISSQGFPYDNKQIGYKVRKTGFYGHDKTAIYSNKKLTDVISSEFTEWLNQNKFKISSEKYNKEIKLKLGYFSFQPVGIGVQPKIRAAIKVNVFNGKEEVFSKWYYHERDYDKIAPVLNEQSINNSLEVILEEIFNDDNFIYSISKV